MSAKLKHANTITIMSAISLVFIVLGIIFVAVAPATIVTSVTVGAVADMGAFVALSVIGGLMLGTAGILSLVSSIMVLAINWETKNLDTPKLLWGLLSLFLLGPIGTLVFASIAKKELKSADESIY